jgi:hypothetical protein
MRPQKLLNEFTDIHEILYELDAIWNRKWGHLHNNNNNN